MSRAFILNLAMVLVVAFSIHLFDTPVSSVTVASSAESSAMESKEDFKSKVQSTLGDLNNKISQLNAKMSKSMEGFKEEAKANWAETKNSLDEQYQLAKKKLSELDEAGKEKWVGLKEGVNDALSKLKQTYENAVSKFQSP